jgi:myo-inositol-1(or 4)-monophosphatase
MNRYLQSAIEIAQEAGALLLDEFSKSTGFEYKGGSSFDLVTAADRHSEELIVERLRTLFPQHAIVAEEGSRQESESGYRWYVDPLDGTTNFAHRYPVYCVSMALVRGEETQVGVVHDPSRGETFYAARGEGAWLNQKRIRVSSTERLSESLLVTGFPARKRHESPNFRYYTRFSLLSHGVRRDGSAALDLCYVACGRFDGFWELNLKPWDVAAGTLMAREAGGVVSDFSSVPYRLGGNEVLASNGHVHPELRQVFLELAEQAAAPRVPS